MDVERLSPAVPVYMIFSVIDGSPAGRAGLKPGDIIEYLNFVPAFSLNLDDINTILYGESGRLVVLKINRNGEKLKLQFRLEGKI
jgi:C-terminal processing protease CtpA/Prc